MASPASRQCKDNAKFEYEQSGSIAVFGRNLERRRHVKEQNCPPTCCRNPDCKRSTRKMERLRTPLEKARRSEVSKNSSLPSEFRTAIAQSLESPLNTFHTLNTVLNPHFVLPSHPTYNTCESSPQTSQIQTNNPNSSAIFNNKEVPHHLYNPTSSSSIASKSTVRVRQRRIFRPCRLRRRRPRAAAHTPSSSALLPHQSLAIEPAICFQPVDAMQVDSTAFQRWMAEPFDVDLIARSLWSFSLDYSVE